MKLLFVSLGCDKNLVDSEYMLGMLEKAGIEITDDENDADIIVVNTCCFINDAKEESVNTILEMAQLKTEGKCKALLVTGCLAERYREEIETEIPEVDAILGTNSYDAIVNAVNEALKGKKYERFAALEGLPKADAGRMQQALYVLYHPVYPWKLPQCTVGRSGCAGKRACGFWRKGTDPGRTGDDSLRRGSLW